MSPRWGFIFEGARFYTYVAPLGLKTLHTDTIANPRNPCNPRQSAIQTNWFPTAISHQQSAHQDLRNSDRSTLC